MAQKIHLAAIVASEGRLLLVRHSPNADWELPGGPLLPEHADAEAGIDAHLARFGISAPAIEEDFLDTLYLPDDEGYVVYNLYAASEWCGEPGVPPGVGLGWFAPTELEAIPMHPDVRDALLVAFGLREPVDRTAEMVASLTGAFGGSFRVTETSTAGADPSQGSAVDLAHEVAAFRRGESLPAASLDGRTQGLIQVAILAATGHAEDLPAHVERALGDGASPVDLIETMRVVGHFAGVPAASAASRAVEDVLRSHGLAFAGEAP